METAWAIAGTIAGVIVGSIGTYIIESRTIRREEILAARLELPPMRSVIWEDNPLPLREQVGRIRAPHSSAQTSPLSESSKLPRSSSTGSGARAGKSTESRSRKCLLTRRHWIVSTRPSML
jgi:hypothetical protein